MKTNTATNKEYTDEQWFNLICESYLNPPVMAGDIELPKFPADQIQITTTGQCGIPTLKEAYIFYIDCLEYFNRLGKPIDHHHILLDFGVGWGRVARFFIKDLLLQNIYGIDVAKKFIKNCQNDFKSNNFFVTTPYPPTLFPDEKFDFIIGYSVFSHLSEKACRLWMEEFHRILKPGGIIALTTRGRHFFDYCENLKFNAQTGHRLALSKMFDDFTEARVLYDSGKFVHSNNLILGDSGVLTSEFYGESFIPEEYAKHEYSDHFRLEKFLFDASRQSHPIMFFTKNNRTENRLTH